MTPNAHADEIVPEVDLDEAVLEQRVIPGQAELPRPLGLEIGVAGVDPVR